MKKTVLFLVITFIILGISLSGCFGEKDVTYYTFHDVYVGKQYLIDTLKNTSKCEDIFLNEDNSLTIALTESQRKKMLNYNDVKIFIFALDKMGISIKYNENYTEMEIVAPDGVAQAASPMVNTFAWNAERYQVLNGVESWSLKVTVVNKDTGEIEQEVTLPDEELDWSFIEN